jgi:hypothetical protein
MGRSLVVMKHGDETERWRSTLSGASTARRPPGTYFVGRRPYKAAEVYAVTDNDVQRLHRDGGDGPLSLDWRGQDARVLELSRVLLARVVRVTPRRELAAQFALNVLAGLPDDGFVLDSDEIWRWLDTVSEPHRVAGSAPRRESLLARLSAAFRRSGAR